MGPSDTVLSFIFVLWGLGGHDESIVFHFYFIFFVVVVDRASLYSPGWL